SLTSKVGDIAAWGIKLDQLRPVVAFLRGDHLVNETKLNSVAGTTELRPMTPEELALHIGGPAGYLGPVGIPEVMTQGSLNGLKRGEDSGKISGIFREDGADGKAHTLKTIVILDLGLESRQNMVAGANKFDYHLRNVVPGRDFTWTVAADIRSVNEGEACPKDACGGKLVVGKAVEVGHIFKLGYKYSESMGARVLDPNGKEVTPIMGSYGIGIERILTAAIEQSNDANGFCLPASIAPFHVVVTVTNIADATLREAGEKIAMELDAAGLDVLLDDRDERAGVKFKDADLVGIPYRINVGKKTASGAVEVVTRASSTTEDVALTDVIAQVKRLVAEERLLADSF
ncbi:MAG: proline--tRNA ligase, partial [Acidobacteria bacterium]